MKKILLILFSSSLLLIANAQTRWGVPPAGWGDFSIGLTDDATKLPEISTARAANTSLQYRVRYINAGVDIASNWYSWYLGGGSIVTKYITDSEALNMRPAFNIYMLQEDGGATVAINNMKNATFMQKYFWNIKDVAQKCNGHKAALIIEPDTWGYLIKACYPAPTSPGTNDPTIRPNLVTTCNLSGLGFPELAGLPNTMAGVAQGIIKIIRANAPDATLGFHTNHWATWSNGATGPSCLGTLCTSFYTCSAGMPFWSVPDINAGADFQIAWYKELLGGASACDKGDFLVVEKYGFDEGGRWVAFGAGESCLYYGNTQYQNWLAWSKRMGQGINLPLLGWQIPVGHIGLPNVINQYEDTFMPYFFGHKSEFYCAGFIGLFMGPGVGMSTLYTNAAGSGDGGWFFSNLRSNLDPTRPVNMNVATNGCGGTPAATPGCGLVPLTLLSFGADKKSNYVDVGWTTTNEKNLSHFILQKSSDGNSFEDIAYIDANDKIESYNQYTFDDYDLKSSAVYYRLKEVDNDGSFSNSQIITIYNETPMFSVYPNPASKNLNAVIGGNFTSNYSIKIFNIQGIEVKSTTLLQQKNSINISDLSPSLYQYQIIDEDGNELSSGKLIVE